MDKDPQLPVAISYIGSKYLLFDINAVTWLRRTHNICGVMGGTLPQSPSQNIFLGLPIQIMPEEAQLLVERGVGYIVDDAHAHDHALQNGNRSEQAAYSASLLAKGEQVSRARAEEKDEARRLKMKSSNSKAKGKVKKDRVETPPPSQEPMNVETTASVSANAADKDDGDTSLFDSPTPTKSSYLTTTQLIPHGIVPTTSELWLPQPTSPPAEAESRALLPNVPPSYALYRHLNSRSYFMTPGLRFGCQYCVYPGDPLRFHSHFLAVGKGWDEEIDLMDIVGGGRLGTGVKKGFLIGGEEPPGPDDDEGKERKVRTFSIEWAVM